MFKLLLLLIVSSLSGALGPLEQVEEDTYVLVVVALDIKIGRSGSISYNPVLILPKFMLEIDLNNNKVSTYNVDPRVPVNLNTESDVKEYYADSWARITIGPRKLKSFQILIPKAMYTKLVEVGQTIAFSDLPDYLPNVLGITPFLLKQLRSAVTQLGFTEKFTIHLSNLKVDGQINSTKDIDPKLAKIQNVIFELPELPATSIISAPVTPTSVVPVAPPDQARKDSGWISRIKSWFNSK